MVSNLANRNTSLHQKRKTPSTARRNSRKQEREEREQRPTAENARGDSGSDRPRKKR